MIDVERLHQQPVDDQPIEIVERKGTGHPDTICDAVVERISQELCRAYRETYGSIQHHNVDKALLSAGGAANRFGGGVIEEPMKLVLGDRATELRDGFDVATLAEETATRWIEENLRYVDAGEDVEVQVELKESSSALRDIFERGGVPANDTSAVVGYAPKTTLEEVVLSAENFLNGEDFKDRHPESGEDVKVMGLRRGEGISLTVANAFVDRHVSSEDEYFRRKEEVLEELKSFLFEEFGQVQLELNTLDSRERGVDGCYLTVTGTSAEAGDSGQVGRGNRVNGLISLNRPSGSEAGPGKNPVAHSGKIYNALSFRLAEEIYQEVPEVDEVYVWLLSKIGRPLDEPLAAAAQLVTESALNPARDEVEEIVARGLREIPRFSEELARGEVGLY